MEHPSSGMEQSGRILRAALAAVIILALAVRLMGLTREPLDNDEYYSIRDSTTLSLSGSRPLYFVILYGWRHLLGEDSVFLLRLPAVLFGAASVFLLYVLARKLFGRDAALTAALFLAISPFHVYASQMVRMYSCVTFLGLATVHAFLLLVESERPLRWIYFFSAAFAAFLCQPMTAFIPCLGFLHLILFRRNDRVLGKLALLAAAGALAVLVSPLRSLVYEVLLRFEDGLHRYLTEGPQPVTFHMPPPTWDTLARTFLQFCGMPRSPVLVFLLCLFFLAPLPLLCGPGPRGEVRARVPGPERWLLFALVLGPPLCCFAVSQVFILYVHRYFIFGLPVLLMLTAASVCSMRPRALRGVWIAGCVVLSLYGCVVYGREINHPDLAAVSARLRAEYRKGDLIVTTVYHGDTILNRHLPRPLPVQDLSAGGLEHFLQRFKERRRVFFFGYSGDETHPLYRYLHDHYPERAVTVVDAVNLNTGKPTPRYMLARFAR